MIREIDKDENVTLVSKQGEVHETTEPLKDDDDATLAGTLLNIKRSTTKDKGKAKETARQEQEKYNLEKALELQKQLDQREEDVDKGDQTKDIDWNDPKVLRYHALQNKFFSKSKKQKLDEQTDEEVEAQADTDQEVEEMKLYVKIVPDRDIAIDNIPLATKPLVIVEYKIVKEGKISTYHIIRVDGSTKRYTLMNKLLENIDREDLETLWKLVKDKHENTRPEEDYKRVLWGNIKVMFEPDIERSTLVEVLNERSMKEKDINTVVEEEKDNWMTPIIQCLEKGVWPKDKNEARNLRVKINQYAMDDGMLFKKSYLVPMLRCKSNETRILLATMHEDAKKKIQKYDSCQIHPAVLKLPKTFMTSIMAPWPFYQWGMDILRPLSQAAKRVKYVIVAIDYFTKWMKAKPLAKITGKETEYPADEHRRCSPQANRLVERANKSLMERIKTRLGRGKAGWVDELPNVLWAHQTSLKTSNGETLFSLTYGSEVVISA
nr:reverse transcriptase domain-containing protein [Tanacetum cinerariifolium]